MKRSAKVRSPRVQATRPEPHAQQDPVQRNPLQPDPWTGLATEWQAAGREWANWWMRTASGASVDAMPEAASGAMGGVTLPATPAAWIPPDALAELTRRYHEKFEALWSGGERGEAAHAAHPGDRRFSAKAWRDQPYFALIKDAYLLYSDYIRELTELAQVDPGTKKKLAFVADQFINAIAPSNFLATNPDALQLALDSGGASIAQGASNLIADAQRGRIAMTDETAFEVGRNLAVTPGSVVFRNELIELIQYAPATSSVFKRPLLIVPPCINKYYILDLQPENSFVKYAVDQGHTVFMISWRNIPAELGTLTWDDYVGRGVLAAIDVARDIASTKTINALGFCVGGTLLASALAVLAARHTPHVSSVTLLTTMLDFSDPGDIGVYISQDALAAREPALLAGSRVRGSELASAFASLRPNELVWNYVVGNYLKGQTPPAFDLLYWNGDSPNLPGPMYFSYVRDMYLGNRLREPGALAMCGQRVDLGSISMPAYVYASREDHIVPWRTAYRTVGLVGGDVTFVLGASGHIAGVVNPPAKQRRSFWTNELLTDDADDWLARATAHPGSWWPHWAEWLSKHGGALRPSPTKPGNQAHRVLAPAPGSYVTEQVS
jgi:polyhydroxyalkanoate synthase subunit PhaC